MLAGRERIVAASHPMRIGVACAIAGRPRPSAEALAAPTATLNSRRVMDILSSQVLLIAGVPFISFGTMHSSRLRSPGLALPALANVRQAKLIDCS
jgi:hypothetical protein